MFENLTAAIKCHRVRAKLEGQRVLVRSNEDEPLVIGNCVDFTTIGNLEFPIVEKSDGTKIMPFGFVVPFSEEVLIELAQLTPKEQWDLMVKLWG